MQRDVPPWAVELLTKFGRLEEAVDTLKDDVNGILDRERQRLQKAQNGRRGNGNGHGRMYRYGPWAGGIGGGGAALGLIIERLLG